MKKSAIGTPFAEPRKRIHKPSTAEGRGMTSDTSYDYLSEDRQLCVGNRVKAYWCKDGFYYQGEGVIVQLARDKVSVELQQRVAWSDDYKAGKTIQLPRVNDKTRWSSRNCVRLLRKSSSVG